MNIAGSKQIQKNKKFMYFLILVPLFMLYSCSPDNKLSPTTTPTPRSIVQTTLTNTPTPTQEIFILENFTAMMVGIETHGNMTCITYPGDQNDIIELTYRATFSQNSIILDSNIPAEFIDNNPCFENMDAKYMAGVPVDMILEIQSDTKLIQNWEQNISLPVYQVFPFFRWIYGDIGMSTNVGGGFRDDHLCWDLMYFSTEYPNSVGVPIYGISDGEMIVNQIWYPYGEDSGYVTNILARLDDLGLAWQFGHIDAENPPIKTETCPSFVAGDLLATVGKKDAVSSMPHTHFCVQTIIDSFWHSLGEHAANSYIDPFSSDPFGDGLTNLQYGLWLPEYLPQEVKNLIDAGFFEINYSAHNNPELTSPSISLKTKPDFPCDIK